MSGETDENQSSLTPDLVMKFAERQIDDLKTLLDERSRTQAEAVRAAFVAQETAMRAAFASAEKAVDKQTATLDKEFHEHLIQYRHEVTLAFEASDKAISKAETATEKRLASMNEFRAQLADQAATLLARTEAEARFRALQTKLDDEATRNLERFAEVNKRLDLSQGNRAGASQLFAVIGAGVGLLLAVLGVVAFFNARG